MQSIFNKLKTLFLSNLQKQSKQSNEDVFIYSTQAKLQALNIENVQALQYLSTDLQTIAKQQLNQQFAYLYMVYLSTLNTYDLNKQLFNQAVYEKLPYQVVPVAMQIGRMGACIAQVQPLTPLLQQLLSNYFNVYLLQHMAYISADEVDANNSNIFEQHPYTMLNQTCLLSYAMPGSQFLRKQQALQMELFAQNPTPLFMQSQIGQVQTQQANLNSIYVFKPSFEQIQQILQTNLNVNFLNDYLAQPSMSSTNQLYWQMACLDGALSDERLLQFYQTQINQNKQSNKNTQTAINYVIIDQ